MAYCKKIGSTGPVMLFTATKAKNKELVQCNADGSDIVPEAPAPAPAPAPVVVAEVAPAPEPVERKSKFAVSRKLG